MRRTWHRASSYFQLPNTTKASTKCAGLLSVLASELQGSGKRGPVPPQGRELREGARSYDTISRIE